MSSNTETSLNIHESADQQVLAIESACKHFLESVYANLSSIEREERFEKIQNIFSQVDGGFHAYWVHWLFNKLELIAREEIAKISCVPQTTSPNEVKKLFPSLPDKLIENSNLVHEHIAKTARQKTSSAGGKAKARNSDMSEQREAVKTFWLEWQKQHHLYKTNSEFATEMLKKYIDLSYDTVIKKWIPKWKKEYTNSK